MSDPFTGWGQEPHPRLPMIPGTETRDPEVEHGPRVNTSGCPNCETVEGQAWRDYIAAFLNCSIHSTEEEVKFCRKNRWITYLDTVYDCFQNQGCFGV